MAILNQNSYFGKLVSACLAELGDKKTPTMVLDFELTHQALNGKWDAITEVRRSVSFFLSEKAREASFTDLRKLGFNGDMEDPKFSADLSEGTEITIEHEEYQGKIQERARIAKIRSMEKKPASKDVARLLAAQFKQSAISSARPTQPPPALPAAQVGDDGVPF